MDVMGLTRKIPDPFVIMHICLMVGKNRKVWTMSNRILPFNPKLQKMGSGLGILGHINKNQNTINIHDQTNNIDADEDELLSI